MTDEEDFHVCTLHIAGVICDIYTYIAGGKSGGKSRIYKLNNLE